VKYCILLLAAVFSVRITLANELVKVPDKSSEKLESSIAISSTVQPVQRLADVKKIFVASLGNVEGSEAIRQTIINRLSGSDKVSVVDNEVEADATLTGVAELHSGMTFSAEGHPSNNSFGFGGFNNSFGANRYGGTNFSASGGTNYSSTVEVRLIGKSKSVLWTSRPNCRPISRRAYSYGTAEQAISSSANKVAKDLSKAIVKDKDIAQISNNQLN
jgi:hypothetical protein